MSGQRNKPTERGTLTFWRRQRPGRDLSGHGKKSTEQGTPTNWIQQREGPVRKRTQKESERARRTHTLEATDGGLVRTRKGPTERNTHQLETIEGRDLSGHRKKLANRGTLTNWGRQREGLIRIQNETGQTRHTHQLKTAEGGTCQDMERNRANQSHSHPGDGRGRDLSGHRKKSIEPGALTAWRKQREGLVRTQK